MFDRPWFPTTENDSLWQEALDHQNTQLSHIFELIEVEYFAIQLYRLRINCTGNIKECSFVFSYADSDISTFSVKEKRIDGSSGHILAMSTYTR